MKNKLILLLIIFGCFLNPSESFSIVYIDINAPVLRKFPIAIAEIIPLGKSDDSQNEEMRKSAETLVDDIKSTGMFEILDAVMFLEDANKAGITLSSIDFDDWTVIGAEGLIKGGFTIDGNGRLELELRLFDTYQKRMIIGKKYIGRIEDTRRIMHRFANEIMREFTGERGIFGSKIAYVNDTKSYKEIFIMDYDGSGNMQITRDFTISLSPAWSPDGTKLSYTSYKEGNPNFAVNDFTKRETTVLSKRKGLNLGGEWSPNGKQIALAMNTGNNTDIYIIDAESGEVAKKLTDFWGISVSPTWSPDGSKIAFTSDRPGKPNIYVIDVDSGEAKRISFDGKYNSSPSWSPRGDKIAFCGQTSDDLFNIFIINPDGTGLTQLTSGSKNNENPTWSPDGRQIAFTSSRNGNYDIYVMNANGAGIRQLTSSKGDETAPSWSPRLE